MDQNICNHINCTNPVDSTRNIQNYCGDNCRKAHQRALMKTDHAKFFDNHINFHRLAKKLETTKANANYIFLFGLQKQLNHTPDKFEAATIVVRNLCFDKTCYTTFKKPTITRTPSNGIAVNDILEGGLSDFKTVEQIAAKHHAEIDYINQQLAAGIEVEKEHTNNLETAAEIAKDHLWERPDYYVVLASIENAPSVVPQSAKIASVEKLETGGPINDKNFDNPVYAELVAAESDLDKAVKSQELMKKANSIIKSNKDVETRLKNELNLSEQNIYKLINPDRFGRVGFASYSLTNNNANIKRLRERVAMLTKKHNALKSDKKEAYTFDGGRIEVNYPLDRVQIFFDEKPDADTRTKMKSSGWKWAPSEGAWQRKNTPDALFVAKRMFNAVGDVENTVIETVAPVRTYTVDDITDRNFSLVNMSAGKAYTKELPQDEVTRKALNNLEARLIVFSADRDVVKATIKAYLQTHMPDLDFSKVSISTYPQTYVNDAKKLLAAGYYLPKPDTAAPGKTLFPLYNNYRFLEDYILPKETDLSAPRELGKQTDSVSVEVPEFRPPAEQNIVSKKQVKLNRFYNGMPEGTILDVIEKPNMFVTRVKFGETYYTIDNGALSKIDAVPVLNFPKLPYNHPLNILDPKSSQYQQALEEERSIQESESQSTIAEKIPAKEQVINPNTDEDFDEAILSELDPDDEWVGNLIKERVVKSQIYKQLIGPEEEKRAEVERLFFKFAKQQYPNNKIHEMHQPKTIYQSTKIDIVDYDAMDLEELKIIHQEKYSNPDITTPKSDDEKALEQAISKKFSAIQTRIHDDNKKLIEARDTVNAIGPSLSDAPDEDRDLYYKAIKYIRERGFDMQMGVLKKTEKPEAAKSEELMEKSITESAFQGINHSYKNQYVLNKAIEALLQQKGISSSDYTSDEKAFLRKYSGYGGLDKYGKTGKGGLFEYYTPTEVIKKMWALAYKYGYNNGSVLEPSVGTGEFLQFLKPGIRCVGYDISSVSAQICKILYPHVEVITQPFEQIFIKNNWTIKDNTENLEKFDLVIGNPPYGDFSIVESRYMSGMGEKDHVRPNNYVEYFLRRSVDLLKPGGLLIFIVGSQIKAGGILFLDSGPSNVKEYLQQNCEMLDAYRLPDSIFERTGVTSDIIVLKKI